VSNYNIKQKNCISTHLYGYVNILDLSTGLKQLNSNSQQKPYCKLTPHCEYRSTHQSLLYVDPFWQRLRSLPLDPFTSRRGWTVPFGKCGLMGSANAQIFVYGVASETLTLINPNQASQQTHAVQSDWLLTGPDLHRARNDIISLQRLLQIELKGVMRANYPQLTIGMNFSGRSCWVGFKVGMYVRIQCFLLIQLKPKHQGFKANVATRELNTSEHQKHEPRRRLRSGTGQVWSGAVKSYPMQPVRLVFSRPY